MIAVLYVVTKGAIIVVNIGSIGSSQIYNISAHKSPAPEISEQTGVARGDISVLGENEPEGLYKKNWTVLLYSAADNNLENALVKDVAELETVGSNKNMNLLVQLDRGENPSSISGGWSGCRRFYLNKDTDSKKINSPVLDNLGQVNMSDPKVLADFITWGIKNYPAENYMLIMSDHGAGWAGAVEDGSHKGWMTTPQLREALESAQRETGEKIDILGFDACLMASTEVAHELADNVGYMVASQNVEGINGWPYARIFTSRVMRELQEAIDAKFSLPPEMVARKIVNDSIGSLSVDTLSAVDLSKMKELSEYADDFARAIISSDVDRRDLIEIANKTKSFSGYKDQYDFAERIVKSPKIKDEKVKVAARTMMRAFRGVIVAEHHTQKHKGAHGLSMEISPGGDRIKGYMDLKFAQETKWPAVMDQMDDAGLS